MGTVRHVAGLRFTRGRRRPVQPRAPCALTPRSHRPGGCCAARLVTTAAQQLRQVECQIVSQGAAAERADSYPSVFYHVRQQI